MPAPSVGLDDRSAWGVVVLAHSASLDAGSASTVPRGVRNEVIPDPLTTRWRGGVWVAPATARASHAPTRAPGNDSGRKGVIKVTYNGRQMVIGEED